MEHVPVAVRSPWLLIWLLVVSVFINYIDRSNLSVAAPVLASELSLNPARLGLLFSAFFWTYSMCQIFSGLLVDRYDVNWVYAAGFCVWSVATFATGIVSSFGELLVMRLVLGAGESVVYPAVSKIIVSHFPEHQRGTANALIDAGSKAGPGIGTLAGGLLVAHYGWRPLFLTLGLGSLLWLVPWCMFARREATVARAPAGGGPGFFQILTRRDAWATSLGMFCYGYAWYFLLTWLPSYLVMERHFSMAAMAVVGSLSFLAMAVSTTASGWASDRWIARGTSPTVVRKTFVVSGLLLCILVFPAALAKTNTVAVSLLFLACVALGLYSSNTWALTQTLAGPSAAGRWSGIQNAVGNLGGALSAFSTGWIVTRTGSFLLAFAAVALMLLAAACVYLFLVGRIEPLSWRVARDAVDE